MTTYKFSNGDIVSTELSKEEMLKRMNRLDKLRVMMEGYEEGQGLSLYEKSLRAYNKTKNFTGIIRLNGSEKDFLSYRLDDKFISDDEIAIIRFYCNITDETWKEIISVEGNEHLANR